MSMSASKIVFRSRVSVLLTVFVLAILAPPFLSASPPRAGLYVVGGILLLILLLLTGMRYVVSEGRLFCKIWFIPYGSVDIAEIRSVKRSYNPLSSPAASLKRLRVSFGNPAKQQYPVDLAGPRTGVYPGAPGRQSGHSGRCA